jgi:hypothetical protein
MKTRVVLSILLDGTHILEEIEDLPLNVLDRLRIRKMFCSHWDSDIFRRDR